MIIKNKLIGVGVSVISILANIYITNHLEKTVLSLKSKSKNLKDTKMSDEIRNATQKLKEHLQTFKV